MFKNLDIKRTLSEGRNYLLCGLVLIATGLSVSKPLMSLGLIFLCVSWLVGGNYSKKIKLFLNNKTALILSSVYLITLFGLIHTTNYSYGFDDVRKKLALFLIPFVISGFDPLSKKEFSFLLKVFVFWVLFSCLWSFCVYFGITGEVIVDKREYSRFTSHIRFGLEIAFAVFVSVFFLKNTSKMIEKLIWFMAIGVEIATLYFFNFITGSVALMIGVVVLFFSLGLSAKSWGTKLSVFSVILGGSFLVLWFISSSFSDFYNTQNTTPIELTQKTNYGEPYHNNFENKVKENGYYLERNIAWGELADAWNSRSKIDFEGHDLKGNLLKYTLLRFVTSKGLKKDRDGIEQLTDEEISAIEKGIPNVKYLTMNGFSIRMHKIIWEYDAYKNGQDINGHSVLMRWEYLKVTLHLIKNNFWFGIGTGDIQDAYKQHYKESKSKLKEHYRRRGHNQYLTYFVTLGILGGVWFLFVLFYPIVKLKLYKNYLYVAFFSILCVSMLTEDTLENQVGIYFFVFFNSVFLSYFSTARIKHAK